jgi:putative hydrolase of the HAD superfamily
MIRAILFDFGQTLVDSAGGFRQAEGDVAAKIFADVGCRDQAQFLEIYRRVRREFSRRPEAGRPAAWEEVYEHFQCRSDARILRGWEGQYWRTVVAGTRLFPETTGVVELLSKRFLLGIVSNTQGERGGIPHRLACFPQLTAHFDAMVVAGHAGIPAKPDSTPFCECLRRLDVAADQAIHVGDDWHADIEGARHAGIRPVWLQHHSVERRWPAGDGSVSVIRSLTDLLEMDGIVPAGRHR